MSISADQETLSELLMIVAKDEEHLSKLHQASKEGNLNGIKSLLNGGYHINTTSGTRKETALHLAVQVRISTVELTFLRGRKLVQVKFSVAL